MQTGYGLCRVLGLKPDLNPCVRMPRHTFGLMNWWIILLFSWLNRYHGCLVHIALQKFCSERKNEQQKHRNTFKTKPIQKLAARGGELGHTSGRDAVRVGPGAAQAASAWDRRCGCTSTKYFGTPFLIFLIQPPLPSFSLSLSLYHNSYHSNSRLRILEWKSLQDYNFNIVELEESFDFIRAKSRYGHRFESCLLLFSSRGRILFH